MPSLLNPGLCLLWVNRNPRILSRLLVPAMAALALSGCAGYQSLPESGADSAASITGSQSTTAGQNRTAQQLTQVFERYRGTPYRYGGTTAQGFDCSGFIVTAYREGLGQGLPRTTGQMLADGHFVRRDQLQAGDLVFFRIGGKEQHAGIYLGDNRFIHSSSSKGVMESSLANPYWHQRYSQARRFL